MSNPSQKCGVCLEMIPLDGPHQKHGFETLLCGHKVCTDCFVSIIEKTNNHVCPFCREPFYPISTNSNNRIGSFGNVNENEWDQYISEHIDQFIRNNNEGTRKRRNRKRRGCFRKYITPSIIEELFLMEL